MEVKKFNDLKIYQKIFEFMRMGNKSVQLAIAENKKNSNDINIVFPLCIE